MKVQHVLMITLTIVILVSLLCISLFPSFQNFLQYNTLWNGLRHSLNTIGASTIDSLNQLTRTNNGNVLISIPYKPYKDNELEAYESFVDNGGTLILMDDFGYGNSILEYLNVDNRFSGTPLLDPLYCYKNQWFPEITDFSPSVSKNVKEVILNHATALINTENTQVIAWSSPNSFLDQNGNESWDEGEVKGPLPVAAEMHFQAGTIILVSDPSILINNMLNKGDNLLFIKNLIGPETNGEQILVDTSHLVKDPLEITKSRLVKIKSVLSQPYAVLGIVFLLFVSMSIYMLRTGGSIGRKS